MITKKTGKPKEVMADDVDRFRLKVAVELVNAPPVPLWPPRHLETFQQLLAAFFRAGVPGGRRVVVKGAASEYPGAAVAELKDWTASFLSGWLDTGRAVIGIAPGELSSPLLFEFIRDKSGSSTIGAVKGPVSEVWAFTLGNLLASKVGQRLRRCGDPKCGSYFVKEGKMDHCSTRCARRVYMRRYRKTSGTYEGRQR